MELNAEQLKFIINEATRSAKNYRQMAYNYLKRGNQADSIELDRRAEQMEILLDEAEKELRKQTN